MPAARAAALRLLTRRDYTTAELRDKLLAAEHEPADIDETIAYLTRERLLDDRRVAEAHARTACRVKGRGRLRIQRELEARGIDRDLAREVTSALSESDEAAALERFLERKRIGSRLDAGSRRRLFHQLLRRGFPAHLIAQALKRAK
jgi:regulatory protein